MTPDRWTKRQDQSRLERYVRSSKRWLDASDQSTFVYRGDSSDYKKVNDWLESSCAHSFGIKSELTQVTAENTSSPTSLWGMNFKLVCDFHIAFASEDDATLFAIMFPEAVRI